jgi:hypothetical protein
VEYENSNSAKSLQPALLPKQVLNDMPGWISPAQCGSSSSARFVRELAISQVAAKRFLGLPYVTVAAHPRHIQESTFLFHAERLAEWGRAGLAAL